MTGEIQRKYRQYFICQNRLGPFWHRVLRLVSYSGRMSNSKDRFIMLQSCGFIDADLKPTSKNMNLMNQFEVIPVSHGTMDALVKHQMRIEEDLNMLKDAMGLLWDTKSILEFNPPE